MSSHRLVHLSIDDVWRSMELLGEKSVSSIFDVPFFAYLQRLHKKYGACFTLYVVGHEGTFDLEACGKSFREAFERNADWLRFALHCCQLSGDTGDASNRYFRYWKALEETVGKKSLSNIVRLHGFDCDVSILERLPAAGITTLLCADDERVSYGMTQQEDKTLRDRGCLEKTGITYVPTAIRLENGYHKKALDTNPDGQYISAFTHEYFFYGRRQLLGKARLWRFIRTCVKKETEFFI